jgi:hypothetical protein
MLILIFGGCRDCIGSTTRSGLFFRPYSLSLMYSLVGVADTPTPFGLSELVGSLSNAVEEVVTNVFIPPLVTLKSSSLSSMLSRVGREE